MKRIATVLVLLSATLVQAQGWSEPARGTALRAALMDAIRPHADWALGPPVEFVVHELRQSGKVAFASLYAQRPGGREIDVTRTPMYLRGEIDPEIADGLALQVLYRKEGNTWVAVHWAFGATDVWWSYGPLCREYFSVISDACVGVAD